MSFTLYEFQDEAVAGLRAAIAAWSLAAEQRGQAPSDVDGNPIPLLAHLTAITGAGKTPILAKVIGGVGPAVVLWTTNREVVISQTVAKLNDDYRHFLPPNSTVVGEAPTPDQWSALIDDEDGLFIWCRSVASWNAPNDEAKGTEAARQTIHRSAADTGDPRSRWEQLADLDTRKRPLWVVYDESHGQTDVQLDQLLELHPLGVLAASGTPHFSAKIDALRENLETSATWGPIAEAAMVEVPTQAVAAAGLLKTGIEMDDLNTDDASRVQAAVTKLAEIAALAEENNIALSPRAIFVTQESDRATGDPRPVVLWNFLTQRFGIDPKFIAIGTSTRELPKEAERVTNLSQLKKRHRFLIFNKKFQEGWDDPQAYVAYFDGETKSELRIKQIIGRIIRQPDQRAFNGLPDLNTAFIFVSSPDAKFAAIVEGVRKHLLEEYGTDQGGEPNVTVRTRAQRPAAVPLRAGAPLFELPMLTLEARNLDQAFEDIARAGRREFPPADRAAPGSVTKRSFKLTDTEKKITAQTVALGQHIRSGNRDYFLDLVRSLSGKAFDRLPRDKVAGPMFEQDSAALSAAQRDLRSLAVKYVADFEERVTYVKEPDPRRGTWSPQPLEPTQPASLVFTRSLHPAYPDSKAFLNNDEKPMCTALDTFAEGWWLRNAPSAGMGGYGIPMPKKVGGSETFYPDFLWFIDQTCYAIDTTGLQILPGKVRGKLLDIGFPKIALVVRGKVAASLDTPEDKAGWTLMLPGAGGPRRLFFNDLGALLADLRTA
jgi:type III restriction enzyme